VEPPAPAEEPPPEEPLPEEPEPDEPDDEPDGDELDGVLSVFVDALPFAAAFSFSFFRPLSRLSVR
jgi:hypothetical protein